MVGAYRYLSAVLARVVLQFTELNNFWFLIFMGLKGAAVVELIVDGEGQEFLV